LTNLYNEQVILLANEMTLSSVPALFTPANYNYQCSSFLNRCLNEETMRTAYTHAL